MSTSLDALRRLRRARRGVGETHAGAVCGRATARECCSMNQTPSLRTDLIRAGTLKLRLPGAEAVVPASALAIADRVRSAYRSACGGRQGIPADQARLANGTDSIARSYGDLTAMLSRGTMYGSCPRRWSKCSGRPRRLD